MLDYVYEESNKGFFDSLPDDIGKTICDLIDAEYIAPLFWSEHCLECGAPSCYKTCKNYESDRYGRCKRTHYGIKTKRIPDYYFQGVQLRFKRWGKLLCSINNHQVFSFDSFPKYHNKYLGLRKAAFYIGRIGNFLGKSKKDVLARTLHHHYIKKFQFSSEKNTSICDRLIICFYSISKFNYKFILDLYDENRIQIGRHSYDVNNGLNYWEVNLNELSQDRKKVASIELYPENNAEPEIVLFFSDLVNSIKQKDVIYNDSITATFPAEKVKCVVWDLDNTLWDGVIGEDGIQNIILKNDIKNVIIQLDEMGILQSISSKNDYDIAWKGVKRFHLDHYFLYPEINWNPKSRSIIRISEQLNINLDTFVFVDDSLFELQEVSSSLPMVRVIESNNAKDMLSKPEFDLPITNESKHRRKYYQDEIIRKKDYSSKKDLSINGFIKSCEIVVSISNCKNEEDLERCYELLSRTNQLNSSTNRYSIEEMNYKNNSSQEKVIKVSCKDKYGCYGVVGCIIYNKLDDVVLCSDFVLSCRIAKKKIESALIYYFLSSMKLKQMRIVYYPTDRNKVLFDEFVAIGGTYSKNENVFVFSIKNMKNSDLVTVLEEDNCI